jgi:hypothetical protein
LGRRLKSLDTERSGFSPHNIECGYAYAFLTSAGGDYDAPIIKHFLKTEFHRVIIASLRVSDYPLTVLPRTHFAIEIDLSMTESVLHHLSFDVANSLMSLLIVLLDRANVAETSIPRAS